MTTTTSALTATTVEAAFKTFVVKAQALVDEYMKTAFPNLKPDVLDVSPDGKRYWRVVKNDGVSRSVYCFVDKTTGDVLKADGWKRPAKGARGNVLNPDNGLGGVSAYGGRYAR